MVRVMCGVKTLKQMLGIKKVLDEITKGNIVC